MLITPSTLCSCLMEMDEEPVLAVDVETTGLKAYKDCTLFALAIAGRGGKVWTIDLREGWSPPEVTYLKERLEHLFKIGTRLLVNHHLKFDLHFLYVWGVEIKCAVYCTEVMARVEYNDHLQYSLAACGERIGRPKSDAVKEYCETHALWEWELIPGKKKRNKKLFYDQVPSALIQEYAGNDALVAFALWESQQASFALIEKGSLKPIQPLVELEQKIIRILFQAEAVGIRLDVDYAQKALAYESKRAQNLAALFEAEYGAPFTDSAKFLSPYLIKAGIPTGATQAGAESVASEFLRASTHELAVSILSHRDAVKRANTYFSSFLYFASNDQRIRCNMRQAGALTARFSCADPNLQNLTNEEDDEGEDLSVYPIRRAFITDPDYLLLSIDYSAMEYRLLFDYAGEMDAIQAIQGGLDPHQACANMMGVTRSRGKTINFALLYGTGINALAQSLGVSVDEAKRLRQLYFTVLPNVQTLIQGVQSKAKNQGFITNWYGRRYHLKDKNFAYRMVNYLIQGGCADIMRHALVNCDRVLAQTRSKFVLQIHDEGIFLIHRTEMHLINELKKAMINAYPHRHLPMECKAYIGQNLFDLEEYQDAEAGNEIQRKSAG